MTERHNRDASMAKTTVHRLDADTAKPLPRDFPDIIELCQRNPDGSHVFPHRAEFFAAAKESQRQMRTEPAMHLDDYLGQFLTDGGHADQKLRLMAATVRSQLTRRDEFRQTEQRDGPGARPAVEIIVPRKAVFDGNIAAITLGEHVADRLTHIAPDIDWRVAYDVVHQAPHHEPSGGRPEARNHPKYRKQKLYMASETFTEPDRAKYLVCIDDTSRYGGTGRDLHVFAQQTGKQLLAFAVFQSYESTSLRPQDETMAAFNRQFGREGQQALDKALKPFGLSSKLLTDAEMRFFTESPVLDPEAGQTRTQAAVAYLGEEAKLQTLPVLLPKNDHFFRHVEARQPLRFSERPPLAGAEPRPQPGPMPA